jgi:hypothetical protein
MSGNHSDRNRAEERTWFYKPPTDADIDKYGSFVAKAMAKVAAERRSSRLFSIVAATATGMLITLTRAVESGTLTAGQVIPNFLAPIVINTVAQLRTERVQRRNLNRLEVIAMSVKAEAVTLKESESSLKERVRFLQFFIQASDLELPKMPEPRPPQKEAE